MRRGGLGAEVFPSVDYSCRTRDRATHLHLHLHLDGHVDDWPTAHRYVRESLSRACCVGAIFENVLKF